MYKYLKNPKFQEIIVRDIEPSALQSHRSINIRRYSEQEPFCSISFVLETKTRGFVEGLTLRLLHLKK